MYATSAIASLLALAPFALASPYPPTSTGTSAPKNFDITVGKGGLKYTPDRIRASKGDTLTFTYFPKAHTVTTSSFAAPCVPLNGTVGQKINSGFVPVADNLNITGGAQQFVVTVQDDKTPIWIYCAQTNGNHCQKGMNMVVNEPMDPAKSLDAYRVLAAKTNISIAAPVVEGGVFQPNPKFGTLPPLATGSSTAAPAASSTAAGQPPKQTWSYGWNDKDGKKDDGMKSSTDYNNAGKSQGGDYNKPSGGDKKSGSSDSSCPPPPPASSYLRARSAQGANSAIDAALANLLETIEREGGDSVAKAATA